MGNFRENMLDKCQQRIIGQKQLLAEKLEEVKKHREAIAEAEKFWKALMEVKTDET